MKAEFNNRVDLQRKVIKIVNQKLSENQLTGLSKSALDSWFIVNNISDKLLRDNLMTISRKLFFIANKSQDQITEEYLDLQSSVHEDIEELEILVNKIF